MAASARAVQEKRLATIAIDARNATTYTLDDQRRMALARNYFAWQGDLIRRLPGRRVLEIGCGTGNFTEMLLDREAIVAIDKEPACVERFKHRYAGHRNLQAFVCDAATDALAKYSVFAPDLCVCLNVLEHVEADAALLRRVKNILAPGGSIALIVPAFPALYGPIDRNLGHFRRYTRHALREVASACGFRVKRLRYMNAVGAFGWWANARIFRREAQSEAQIKFFDRYIAPATSRVEKLLPPPFGQSIFAVLQKT
jgi:SAM-dependent methyltransferase